MTTLRQRTLLLALAGSHAHGTARADSDIDVLGVAVATSSQLLGLSGSFEHADDDAQIAAFQDDLRPDERCVTSAKRLEGIIYSLHKLLRLASSANPNILELLFVRDSELRRAHPLGERLLAMRRLFVTAQCRASFGGYAAGQLSRIQRHHRWHHNGPTGPPQRSDFGLPQATLVPRQQLQAAQAAVRQQVQRWQVDLSALPPSTRDALNVQISAMLGQMGLCSASAIHDAAARWVGLDDNLVEVMQRERRWRSARGEYKRYQTWLSQRNPERSALEARFGYDTKHGAHLVRLLRMGLEIVRTGQVHVWRGDRDADELIAIRDGAWPYDKLCEWAQQAQEQLKTAPSSLPDRPDCRAIDALCIELSEAGMALGRVG